MIPKKLGRFEILKEIGRGAMGQVFLANDPKIERQVAIKTIALPAGTPEEEALETSRRFLREAQAAGRLLHPNIVTIFDVGEENGVSFIAMEFIDGVTLDKHARPGTLLPPGDVLDLVTQAAAALDHAHAAGVIHRDIKPANLMRLKDGTLKITDFGLAKNPSANLTQTGVLLGTPSYMSPEQIQGKELDGRSDLFSLGVVLYELLTGVRPFDADSISTIIYRVLYEDPRPPAAHNPALPGEVNLVIERLLAKDKSRRYPNGVALVADLRKAFSSLPPDTLSRPFALPAAPASPTGVATRRSAAAEPGAPDAGVGTRSASRRARPRAVPPPPPAPTPLIAHHPFKIAALVVSVAAGLLLFPRWVNRAERSHRSDTLRDRVAQGSGAPDGANPGGSGVGDRVQTAGVLGAAAPRAAARVGVAVETVPKGGALLL
ncbi:MAG TPA: serine/threonine-protein kinase, partial [Dongiaceae bacterium]|nr:serine/threonine-protein kinase [Dongiaceae bacterium]